MKLSEIIIGTPVTYWKVIKVSGEKFDPVETEITSEPWEASGQIICKVKGISGGVLITHLENRLPNISIEEIKDFAIAKQEETQAELRAAMRMQAQHGQVFSGAVGEAQRAFRAYTSIIEVINGETPCDPIYISEDY